jgi:hypothetical protein
MPFSQSKKEIVHINVIFLVDLTLFLLVFIFNIKVKEQRQYNSVLTLHLL